MQNENLHDPGGKVRIRLPDGIIGEAHFSPCQRYRASLSRDWSGEEQNKRAILFIGMNPSTADAFVSDPTVNREMNFAKDWGYNVYLKGNVLDWRATSPSDLPVDPDDACSNENYAAIRAMAELAEIIIVAHGRLHIRYQPVIDRMVEICRRSEKPLFCLGRNKDGSPKHPLYLAKTSERIPF